MFILILCSSKASLEGTFLAHSDVIFPGSHYWLGLNDVITCNGLSLAKSRRGTKGRDTIGRLMFLCHTTLPREIEGKVNHGVLSEKRVIIMPPPKAFT